MYKKYNGLVVLLCSIFMFICSGAIYAEKGSEVEHKAKRVKKFWLNGVGKAKYYNDRLPKVEHYDLEMPNKGADDFGVFFSIPKRYDLASDKKKYPKLALNEIELYVVDRNNKETFINSTRSSCETLGADNRYPCCVKKSLKDLKKMNLDDFQKFVIRGYDSYDRKNLASNRDKHVVEISGTIPGISVSLVTKKDSSGKLVFKNSYRKPVKIVKFKNGTYVKIGGEFNKGDYSIPAGKKLEVGFSVDDTSSIEEDLYVDTINFIYEDEEFRSTFPNKKKIPDTEGDIEIVLDGGDYRKSVEVAMAADNFKANLKAKLSKQIVEDGCDQYLLHFGYENVGEIKTIEDFIAVLAGCGAFEFDGSKDAIDRAKGEEDLNAKGRGK